MITIAFASDHAGFNLKNTLIKTAQNMPFSAVDLGVNTSDRIDYPDQAQRLCQAIQDETAQYGVLICGSGVGMCMAANRHSYIRAAHCHNETIARLSRQHNDANVLCLGERLIGADTAIAVLKTFLTTKFEGGRHQQRIDKLS